jgi:hypothetical protein
VTKSKKEARRKQKGEGDDEKNGAGQMVVLIIRATDRVKSAQKHIKVSADY